MPNCLSRWFYQFIFIPTVMKVCIAQIFDQHLILTIFKHFTHPGRCVVLTCLLLIFVTINKYEHLFLGSQCIWISSFIGCPLKSIIHFLLDSLPYYYGDILYISDVKVTKRLHVLHIFSPTIWLAFSIIRSFEGKKIDLISYNSTYLYFYGY